jgi:hypothetical protein
MMIVVVVVVVVVVTVVEVEVEVEVVGDLYSRQDHATGSGSQLRRSSCPRDWEPPEWIRGGVKGERACVAVVVVKGGGWTRWQVVCL